VTDHDQDLRQPAPAWLTADHIDGDAIQFRLAATLEEEDPTAYLDLLVGELRWTLGSFDSDGWAHVSVVNVDTGEEVAGAEAHWSAILRPGVGR
jgi:hypothetical protein